MTCKDCVEDFKRVVAERDELLRRVTALEQRPIDYSGCDIGVQFSGLGDRIWVCVDGVCVLRAKDISSLMVQDDRL
jgi:hypothetical protein